MSPIAGATTILSLGRAPRRHRPHRQPQSHLELSLWEGSVGARRTEARLCACPERCARSWMRTRITACPIRQALAPLRQQRQPHLLSQPLRSPGTSVEVSPRWTIVEASVADTDRARIHGPDQVQELAMRQR